MPEWPSVGDLMGRFLAVKTRVLLILALLGAVPGHGQGQPDPQVILRNVRLAQASQNHTLSGRLRTGGRSIPFRLVLAGTTIRYEFSDPQQTLILRMLDRDSRLEEVSGGSSSRVGPAKFDTMVRDTDISYEDLALKFLYWPNATLAGEETKLMRKCWKILVEPGARGSSQYSRAMLWIEKESGALMQAEAFDAAGNLARRFKVISGQKVDGLWMLKQMRIEGVAQGKSKDRTPTYLEIQRVD
jgi:hypothetical protein